MLLPILFAVAPMIWIPNQLVGAAVGADVSLTATWSRTPSRDLLTRDGGGFMILSSTGSNSLIIDTGIYKVQMRLIINNLRPEDFGSYTCVAKNSLGETEGTIRLYGKLGLSWLHYLAFKIKTRNYAYLMVS
ncbi:hypothetical protein CEXT_90221 [Caerostris extrusa]|uniref:Ig-like domain-containing protein n=1 Tax=Caerostris extrusa TaxID=172846 RepID=A0AAV4NJL2_CAEEX|nr:hypothetical protein CEXT_90221 [Caerostris extrusa]